jgi:hypothetical protein
LVPADHDDIQEEHYSCRQAKLQEVVPVTNGGWERSKNISEKMFLLKNNGKARIRHQCRKTAVISCYRFLINSGVEKMNNI